MNTFSKEELKKKFERLPQDLKDIMLSMDTVKIMTDIGGEFGLHIDQTGKMADQVGLVMLGVMMPTEFVETLTRELAIDRLKANQIANKINEKLFYKIRESLKKVREEEQKSRASEVISGIPANMPDKHEILAGIENPATVPTPPHQIFSDQSVKSKEPLKRISESPLSGQIKQASIIEQKMNEETGLPKIETEQIGLKPSIEEKTKNNDPYREQV